ncbi:type I polyketide synthase [Anaerocolumna sp. AGMB13025]|uniref:type I polyketide synthase n=1 Tax=Anaerocolumna sp. AGMB13025 TaxID=3039116 RepID=UPI00241CB5C9|nr:type I polyketide synthase [Anaerocolumna sp. AGMB13025]WFR55598.1 type I polyketide synthase [Anaerocolumna sp. AGMB13025]
MKGKGNTDISRDTLQEGERKVEKILVAILAELLSIEEKEIDENTDLREFGLDSVALNEFTDMINNRLDTDIDSTLLFEYSNMREIGKYLNEKYLYSVTKYEEPTPDFIDSSFENQPEHIESKTGPVRELSGLFTESDTVLKKIDESRIDESRIDESKIDESRIDESRIDESRIDESKIDESRIDENKIDGSRIDENKIVESKIDENKNDEKKIGEIKLAFTEDVAIIGMSGRLPQSENLKEFWDHLVNQEDLVTEIPQDRWNKDEYYGDPHKGNKANNKCGGFLKDIKGFDAQFFNISPREAELMDPQQRILLEEVWRVFEDAGYKASSVAGSNTGVFIGVGNDDYNELIADSDINFDIYAATGSYFCITANRISYLLNLHGPSSVVDTACSSSLVAIHQAVQAIKNGECEMAVAGGVNLLCIPRPYLSFSHAGMLSKDGRCKTFDGSANGYVRAEGVGAILLKPLSKAVQDGNQIHGVIKGTAVNHCGLTNSLTAPSPLAQAEAVLTAWDKGNITPNTVSYIEAHGTGTSLGDPIEVNGLKKAFEEGAKAKGIVLKENYCGIGSVKSNIGHLEVASGIAGVFKVLLSMKHKLIPGNLHFHKINDLIRLEKSPFYVIDSNKPWEVLMDAHGNPLPRRAGVSSFGFGGTNAHIVIEEYKEKEAPVNRAFHFPQTIIVLSAKTEERLKVYAGEFLKFLRDDEVTNDKLTDIAYTLQSGRELMQERAAILTDSIPDLKEKLEAYIKGEEQKAIFHGNIKAHKKTISIFENDQEFAETLNNWAKKGKYEKILDLWVKGLYFDWNVLYGKDKPGIISLPTYPFKKENFWIPKTQTEKANQEAGKVSFLHPLLHENISDFTEQKYRTVLNGNEFFLKAHVIHDQKILPGVAYLEMAVAAIKAAMDCNREDSIIQLNNIIWAKPVVVKEKPVPIKIALYLESDEEISYQISGEDAGIHSEGSGKLRLTEEPFGIDISAKQRECNHREVLKDECYRAFEQIGFQYGREQRGIERLYIGKDQILARIRLPEEVKSTRKEYTLHPSILDSAVQATMGLMMEGDKMGAFVPFALQKLTVIDPNPEPEWAYIKSINTEKNRNNLKKFDIDLCSNTGKVCIQMKGLTLKKFENTADKQKNPGELLLLAPEWKEAPVLSVDTFQYDNRLIILCEVPEISEGRLKEGLINSTENFSCMELVDTSSDIGIRYKKYTGQIFEEIKKVLADKNSKKNLVQIILQNGDEERLYEALSGLLKTAEQENPRISGQIIEIGPGETTAELIDKIIQNGKSPADKQIAYWNGKRYVKGWKELPEVLTGKKPWRDNGTYLITGGRGELGLIFAREIAKEAKNPTIILTGRGNLDQVKQESLKEIQKLGAAIVYKQADVTDAVRVQGLIEEINKEYGNLHGILYCAGINRDNYIYKKTSEEFQTVLEPKVSGLLNLDQAAGDINLDFFILFSSIAGSLGNPGQADYAAANAFMDEYAVYRNKQVKVGRRFGKTVSINWPLWQNGGMHMTEEAEKLHAGKTGMEALQTDKGLEAFYQIYGRDQEQVMVAMGDGRKIREFIKI